jgi:hypothetical protein
VSTLAWIAIGIAGLGTLVVLGFVTFVMVPALARMPEKRLASIAKVAGFALGLASAVTTAAWLAHAGHSGGALAVAACCIVVLGWLAIRATYAAAQ